MSAFKFKLKEINSRKDMLHLHTTKIHELKLTKLNRFNVPKETHFWLC